MNKWLSLIAIVVLGLALVIGAACGGGDDENGGETEGVTELKFGIGVPLTGGYGAAIGLPAKYAFSLAAEKVGEFTVGGEQYRWKLIFEDNLMSTAGGTAATSKLIYEHNVDFMHQAGSGPALVVVPVTEDRGMILDVAGCDFVDFTPDRPHFFQASATWSLHTPAFFDWLTKEHPEVKTIALQAPEDRTGYAVGEAVVAAAKYFGIEIVAEEYTPVTMVEFLPVATKIMAKDPDLFVVSELSVYESMVAMGYEGPAASYYWHEGGPEKVGWDICEGFILFLPNPVGDVWPEVIAFRAEYEDRYGVELTPAAFWAANVIFMTTGALEAAGTVDDMDKIAETMETEKFDTLVGPIGYGLEELNGIGHVAIYPTPIMQVVGENEYELLKMYTPEETEAIAVEVFK